MIFPIYLMLPDVSRRNAVAKDKTKKKKCGPLASIWFATDRPIDVAGYSMTL